MESITFGVYLRELRNSRIPHMTQEELALAIGRKKMTICQFEQGKNSPPQGELLEKIIVSMDLTETEANKLRFLASESRRTVPNDIEQYFFDNPSICDVIRIAKEKSFNNDFWSSLSERI